MISRKYSRPLPNGLSPNYKSNYRFFSKSTKSKNSASAEFNKRTPRSGFRAALTTRHEIKSTFQKSKDLSTYKRVPTLSLLALGKKTVKVILYHDKSIT